MKKAMLFLAGLGAAVAVAGTDVIESTVVFEQNPHSQTVVVRYTLTEPAIVTVDFQTNVTGTAAGPWASIGAANFADVYGDVNRLVTETGVRKSIYWTASRSWSNHDVAAGQLRAVVNAWSKYAPPDYVVIDLTAAKCVRYYESEAAIPGGVRDLAYKTDKLIMRKVPAAYVRWKMGSAPAFTPGARQKYETEHYVTLTEDYYLSIYEVTQRQYKPIWNNTGVASTYTGDNKGESPNKYTGYDDSDICPVDSVHLELLRGSTADYNWPEKDPLHAVDPNRVLGKLRSYVGEGIEFDLPTEAQWEYACRAGSPATHYDGTWNGDATNLAWTSSSTYPDGVNRPQPVGSLEPNAWGFYDMLGNVTELCQDWYDADTAMTSEDQTNPLGPKEPEIVSSDHNRALRGGCSAWAADYYARCGARYRTSPTYLGRFGTNGIRLCAPARVGE